MDDSRDIFASLLAAIDARLAEPGASEDLPTATAGGDRDSLRAQLRRLRAEADLTEVRLHSEINHAQTTYAEAAFCAECGEPAPCETIRGLAERYEVTG